MPDSPRPFPSSPLEWSLRTVHLREPFRIAHGLSHTRQILRVKQGDHIAEAPFVPYYDEDPHKTLALLQQNAHPDPLPRSARLALNLLHHDLHCHACGIPLSALARERLGPPSLPTPPGCHGLSIPDDLPAFADRVRALATQFSVIKLKLGSGNLNRDFQLVALARQNAPHARLLLDANGGWTLDETVQMLDLLAPFHPTLVEQPFHHRLGPDVWRKLRTRLPHPAIPLFADESAQNAADTAALAPYVDGINVKLLKCGTFDDALTMIATARTHQLSVLLGCMVETSLGLTAAAHLAPWADWIDLDGHLFISDDDFTGLEYAPNGRLLMPDRPGIGARHIPIPSPRPYTSN